MNIGMNRYELNMQTGNISDAGKEVVREANPERVKTAADMSVGETLTGKVLERDGEMVRVLLSDDSVLEARLSKDMQMSPGQLVSFSVKSSGKDGVSLTPLFTNMAEMGTAAKALMNAGMPQTSANMQMVSAMMQEGMSIGKDSLLFMQKQVTANPSADVTNVVQMNHLGISVTEANLEQFQNYKEYEHQINSAVDHIASQVADTFEGILNEGMADKAVQFYKDVMDLVLQSDTEAVPIPQNINPNTTDISGTDVSLTNVQEQLVKLATDGKLSEEQSTALTDLIKISAFGGSEEALRNAVSALQENSPVKFADAVLNDIANQGVTIQQADVLLKALGLNGDNPLEVVPNPEETDAAAVAGEKNELPLEETPVTMPEVTASPVQNDPVRSALLALRNAMNGVGENEPEQISNNTVSLEGTHTSIQTAGLSKNEFDGLITELKNAGMDDNLVNALVKGDISAKEVISHIKNMDLPDDKLLSLLKNTGFQKLVKQELSVGWKITPEQTASKAEVEDLYQKIQEQSSRLMDAIKQASGENTPIANAVNNLQNNVDFMNQLNQVFPYVQLPLKMSQSDAHGELYVYTNKKNLASNDGSVSALLHLDMDHLGPLNVFVKMDQANHVNTDFKVADEKTLDLIAANIDMLTERLEKRGYHITTKYSVDDGGGSVTDEIIKDNRSISLISSGSFDARA